MSISFSKTMGNYLRRIFRSLRKETPHPLAGDRAIEWSWVIEHLPNQPSKILDLGSVGSPITGISARLGHNVTSIDIRDIEYEMKNVNFQKKDIIDIDILNEKFDAIILCSMIEHIGLPDRYGSNTYTHGDLIAMDKLKKVMKANCIIIITIPVGIDSIIPPYHRIYGEKRLPLLFKNYKIMSEEFWCKEKEGQWKVCNRKEALNTMG